MFAFKRNQVIITALVVMIAVAGYLNYTDSKMDAETAETSIALDDNGEVNALVPYGADGETAIDPNYEEGEIGDAVTYEENPEIYAEPGLEENGETVTTNSFTKAEYVAPEGEIVETGETGEAGEAVFVNTSDDSSYFVQAKLEREQARSKEQDILMTMINDSDIEQEQKAECADAMLEMQKRVEKETAAESLIEAKGFGEAYVRIDDTTVDVVVSKQNLTDADIAQIEDIVKRKTGYEANQIRISSMQA